MVKTAPRPDQEDSDEPSRGHKKRMAILLAAADVFKEQGFVGASMDAIAAAASVSKPTIYRYFATKEQLFDAILDDVANRMSVPPPSEQGDAGTLQENLTEVAQLVAESVLSDNLIAMQRLAIAEFSRFPSLTKRFYQHGPRRVFAGFKALLEAQSRSGALKIDDIDVAVARFWGLTISTPHRTKLIDPDWNMSTAEINRLIKDGVAAFIKLYSPPDPPPIRLVRKGKSK